MSVPFVPRVLEMLRSRPDARSSADVDQVAWAVKLHDGSAITFPVEGPQTVTPWPSLQAAEEGLGAYAKPVRQQDIEQWGQVE